VYELVHLGQPKANGMQLGRDMMIKDNVGHI